MMLVDQIKPEIMNPMPIQIIHQTQLGNSTTQTTTASRGSKPQACKVCGKVLSSASSYYVHMKLHSGTKPFQCNKLASYNEGFVINSLKFLFAGSVCEAAFCRKPYLEVHMRTHTGERPCKSTHLDLISIET